MTDDLWSDIQATMKLLDDALREAKSRGAAMVLAEAAYYSSKAEAVYSLKNEGMPATLIPLLVKGDSAVNKAMREYHESQVEYENAREARNVYKKKLDTLREQYNREWAQAGNGEY